MNQGNKLDYFIYMVNRTSILCAMTRQIKISLHREENYVRVLNKR